MNKEQINLIEQLLTRGYPDCTYCGKEPELVAGNIVYPHRSDLFDKHFYMCRECDAYVGVHGSNSPYYGRAFGLLANPSLRLARSRAHQEVDRLWKENHMSRSKTYEYLADEMCYDIRYTHIGYFTIEQCFEAEKIAVDYIYKKNVGLYL